MMHEDEVVVGVEQVRRMVARQFPRWSQLPVTALSVGGTDHSLFRLGADLLARLPRIGWAVEQVEVDDRWLRRLSPYLPLEVPVPVAVGEPDEGYPWRWSVVPWLVGDNPTDGNFEQARAARDLADFVRALQQIDTAGGPVRRGTARGGPLDARDAATRQAITDCGDRIDAAAVTAVWEDALAAPAWTGPGVWLHGDLLAGNLLVRDRRLSAVIDFGGLGVGDPAPDVMPAWSLFDDAARAIYREAAGFDEATWRRGRGWAVSTAVIALPYYWDTFPPLVADSLRKLSGVLADD